MLFFGRHQTDRTVRRKTCLKNWRSERNLFEVPLLNVFWASMLCSFQLSPPHSLGWYTWLWGSVFCCCQMQSWFWLDVSLDVSITSTTSWPVHLHTWSNLLTWPWPQSRRYPERINMDCLQYSLGLAALQSLGILASDGRLLADLVDIQLLSASSPK